MSDKNVYKVTLSEDFDWAYVTATSTEEAIGIALIDLGDEMHEILVRDIKAVVTELDATKLSWASLVDAGVCHPDSVEGIPDQEVGRCFHLCSEW